MKTFKLIGFVVVVFIIIVVVVINVSKLKLISGFAAKSLASNYFLAQRSEAYTNSNDNNIDLVKIAKSKINHKRKTATANVFGLFTKNATYRKGLGAVLLPKNTVLTNDYLKPKRTFNAIQLPYPYGDLAPEHSDFKNIDYKALNNFIDSYFTKKDTVSLKKTRAVLVLYKGKLIIEKYAEGFDEHSLFQGWSMTKSLFTTCFGVLKQENKFDLNAPITAFDTWLTDDRKNITADDLLRMESGLEWEENYSTVCDVTKMLFDDEDVTKRALLKNVSSGKKLFKYASGTSNILSALLRKQFKTHQAYLDYPYKAFVDKIGMHSMLMEADLKGNYVASSYSWANARDWAKFGQLILQNGEWNGTQILSNDWVNYIKTPNKTSKGEYGGHWWLNQGYHMPNVPKDCFYARGVYGQRVFVIPSKDLVVVRLGLTELSVAEFYTAFDAFLSTICNNIK